MKVTSFENRVFADVNPVKIRPIAGALYKKRRDQRQTHMEKPMMAETGVMLPKARTVSDP